MADMDISKPVLRALVLPTSIDLSGGGRYVTFSVGATDVGTGVDYVSIYLKQGINGSQKYLFVRDSDDSYADGVSNLSQYINTTTGAGTYNVDYVIVNDKAGNANLYYSDQLAAMGFRTSFTVTGTATAIDTTKPTLTQLNLPTNIDLSGGGKSVTFSVGATDVGTGVDYVSIYLKQGINGSQKYLFIRDSDDSYADGVSSLSQYINTATGSGTYNVDYVIVNDKAGNANLYYAEQLAAMGFRTSFTASGTTPIDATKPTLTQLNLPTDIDLSGGGKSVTFSVGATDVGTGVDYVSIYLKQGINGSQKYLFVRDSDDSYADGVSNLSQYINTTTGAGTYNVDYVIVNDKAGNANLYYSDQLAAMGFRTSFTVNAAPPPPPLISVAALNASLDEGNDGTTAFSFQVTRTGDLSLASTVSYQVGGQEVTAADFSGGILPSGVVSFAAGEAFKTISILVRGDTVVEGDERFSLLVSDATYGTLGVDEAIATIRADDSVRTATGDYFWSGGGDELFNFAGRTTAVLVAATAGDDRLYGGSAGDSLNGGVGGDRIFGNAGKDVITGGQGADYVEGGIGADTFVINAGDLMRTSAGPIDVIGDFSGLGGGYGTPDKDVIRLSGFGAGTTIVADGSYDGNPLHQLYHVVDPLSAMNSGWFVLFADSAAALSARDYFMV